MSIKVTKGNKMPFPYDQRQRVADFIVTSEKEAKFKVSNGYLFKMAQTGLGHYQIECRNDDGTLSHIVDSGSRDYVEEVWGKI